jgi:D-lactate dehydrogenase
MARQPEASRVSAKIVADYDYDAIQTCAGDGSCAIACPVEINTGALMKHFRHLEHGPRAERVAATFARQFGIVERVARIAVGAADATAEMLGHRTVTAVTNMARAVVSKDLMPGWLPNMPTAAKAKLPKTAREGAAGVYFTACVNRIFGRMPGQERKPSLQETMIAVSARAGMPLWIP